MDKQGKPVPYLRSDYQIQQALANVEANKHLIGDQKGKGNGKGKGQGPCYGETGHVARNCTKQGKGADKGKASKPNPGKGGPHGWGEPGSDPRPCHRHQAGNCRFGADCTFQHGL